MTPRRKLYGVDSVGRRYRTDGGVRVKSTHTDPKAKPLPGPTASPVSARTTFKGSTSPFQQKIANDYEAWAREGYDPHRTSAMLKVLMSGKLLTWFLEPSRTPAAHGNKEYVGRVVLSALAGGNSILGGKQPLLRAYGNLGAFDAASFYTDHKDAWGTPQDVASYRNAL